MNRFHTARSWSIFLGWILEILTLGALAATGEVNLWILIVTAAILLFRKISGRGAGQRTLLIIFAATLLGSVFGALYSHVTPVIAAANAAPLLHGILWLFPAKSEHRGWRLAMGFMELILTSALTTDIYLPITIVAFVIIASVSLSCDFMARELESSGRENLDHRLPKNFIWRSLGLSVLIFLSSAVIFPILPRMKSAVDSNLSSQIGYTEEVNVSSWGKLSDSAGEAVLRLYTDSGDNLLYAIPQGLIRGRVLSNFDGKNWRAAPNSHTKNDKRAMPRPNSRAHPGTHRSALASSLDPQRNRTITIEAIREAIGSTILPTPYSAQSVFLQNEDGTLSSIKLPSGEWTESQLTRSSVHYQITLTVHPQHRLQLGTDLPTEQHLYVPPSFKNKRFERLTQKIFSGTATDSEKIQRLLRFFQEAGFKPSLDAGADHDTVNAEAGLQMTPLEDFLFIQKAGHCELFSSASAILLRMAGVPTRLIAGFRITHSPMQGILTIRNTDAHAWLETWNEERGWLPLDPTPRLNSDGSFMEGFRNTYDLLGAYWARYVVSFEDSYQLLLGSAVGSAGKLLNQFIQRLGNLSTWIGQHQSALLILALGLGTLGLALLTVIRVWFPSVFSIRWRVREGPAVLRNQRILMERHLARSLQNSEWLKSPQPLPHALLLVKERFGISVAAQLQSWMDEYDQTRFGKDLSPDTLHHKSQLLKNQFSSLKKAIKVN